jgi:hypothetical protein
LSSSSLSSSSSLPNKCVGLLPSSSSSSSSSLSR